MRRHDRDSVVFYGGFISILVLLGVIMLTTSGCPLFKTRSRPLPESPFDLTAVALYSDEIKVDWNYLADQHDGFYLYRKDTGDFRKIAVLEANTSSYLDSPLDPETTYSYYMSTYSAAGESDSSETVSATTLREVEFLGYEFSESWSEYAQKWYTGITANVKNQTHGVLTIWVRVNFYSYEDLLVATDGNFASNVESLEARIIYIGYGGERIKWVEVWIEDYY